MLTFLNVTLGVLHLLTAATGLFLLAGGFAVPGFACLAFGTAGTAIAATLVRRWAKMRRETVLLARAGHELRTPLAVLTSLTDRLPEDGDARAIFRRQIGRMNVLVEGTLHGARRIAFGRRVNRQGKDDAPCLKMGGRGVPVTDVLSELERLWPLPGAKFPDKPLDGIGVPRLKMENRLREHILMMPGDDRFHHIVTNLVRNAFQHGIPRLRPIFRPWEVVLRLERNDAGHLVVTVSDEGPGVSLNPLTGIPKSLSDDGRGALDRGTGLGFFIVRELVLSAGGTVRVGTPERGTVVTVSLPVAPAEEGGRDEGRPDERGVPERAGEARRNADSFA